MEQYKYREYDTLQLQLESSMSRIENEVKQYQEEILANETKHNLIELKRMQLQLLEKRANDEIKEIRYSDRDDIRSKYGH